MSNYKVKVNNEAESREVQELLFEMDYFWRGCGKNYLRMSFDFKFITAYCSDKHLGMGQGRDAEKELTIPELRDLVVLKRNDVNDATHTHSGNKYYLTATSFFCYLKGYWENVDEYVEGCVFKPIEKKSMKEFLVKQDDKWTLQLLDSDTEENNFRVVVPNDSNYAYKHSSKGYVYFAIEKIKSFHDLVWMRSEVEDLTQVESVAELGDCDLNTKHSHYKKDVSHLDFVDVYRVLDLFEVESHAVGHAIKKLLLSGGRGAKDKEQDIQEAIDSLVRYQEMKNEDTISVEW